MNRTDEISAITSEAGIIASLIRYPELSFFDDGLLPRHFSSQQNAAMYTALCDLAKKGIKNITALNIIEDLKSMDGAKRYLDMLPFEQVQDFMDNSESLGRATPEEYKLLAKNVKEASMRRDVYQELQECERLCFDVNTTDLEKNIYKKLDSIMVEYNVGSELSLYRDVIDSVWERIERRQSGESAAIEFPFPLLNQYVVLEPGECVCFAAPQKTGKSAMLLTCALDLLHKGKSVLYIDSELSTDLFTMRLIAHETGIKFSQIRSGNYGEEEGMQIEAAKAFMKEQRFIHTYQPMLDDNSLYLIAKKAKHQIDIDVIILDYLKADSTDNQAYSVYTSLGRVTDTLKNKIAGEMRICALTAAQATATGKIADSAKIARNASTIITIMDKTLEEQMDGTDATKKIRVLFNRNGAQMSEGEYIDMCFNGSTCSYWESPKQHAVIEPF